jgi:N6-L-threonylcarbamoyladenine synthase
MSFSLSGAQNKVEKYYQDNPDSAEAAGYVLRCICATILKATENALRAYPGLPIVFSGGVASNAMLRSSSEKFAPIFAKPEFSTDNAMGVAILAARSLEG